MKNVKEVWLVSGWDGDPTCFSSKEKAKEEFIRRFSLLDDYDYLKKTCEHKEENYEYWTAKDEEGKYYYELHFYLIPLITD